MQSYVLLGAEDEGLNPGIGAKKVLDGLLLLGLRDLRVHCCAEDSEVNSAREMFLRLVGLFEHLVADLEVHGLENGRPFVYDEVLHPRCRWRRFENGREHGRASLSSCRVLWEGR